MMSLNLPALLRHHVAPLALAMLCVAGVAAIPLHAQGLGYAVAGPAGVTGFFAISASELHAAGGGELRAASRVGAGGEFGVFGSSRVLLVLSLNGTVYLGSDPAANTVVPFLSTGYSRFGVGDSDGPFNAWNIAGGVDYWAGRRAGVRVELRDHLRLDTRGTVQYWSLRGGIVFR
jgi:hypothetical protein